MQIHFIFYLCIYQRWFITHLYFGAECMLPYICEGHAIFSNPRRFRQHTPQLIQLRTLWDKHPVAFGPTAIQGDQNHLLVKDFH